MIHMINLKERSFFSEDIPEQFYVVTDIQYNVILDNVKKGILEVTGISGSANIVLSFMGVARDLIITMDGQELVKLNRITRIMYDNPHYIVSNNLEALARMFESRKDDFQHILRNVFDYMKMILKKSSDPVYDNLFYTWDFGTPPYYDFAEAFEKMNLEINNVSDFVKTLMEASKKLNNYNGKQHFDQLSYKDLYEVVEGALLFAGKIYQDEKEWILKNKNLILPSDTKFIIGIENIDSYYDWREGKLEPAKEFFLDYAIERWKKIEEFLKIIKNKGYAYSFINMTEFRKVQGIILSDKTDTNRVNNLLKKYPELKV